MFIILQSVRGKEPLSVPVQPINAPFLCKSGSPVVRGCQCGCRLASPWQTDPKGSRPNPLSGVCLSSALEWVLRFGFNGEGLPFLPVFATLPFFLFFCTWVPFPWRRLLSLPASAGGGGGGGECAGTQCMNNPVTDRRGGSAKRLM